MDFLLEDKQIALRSEIIDFARSELNGRVEQYDREGSFDQERWEKCGRFGLLGLPVPRKYGGSEVDPLTMIIAQEAFGFGCTDNGLVFTVGNHLCSCIVPIVKHGSPEQRARYLPKLAEGRWVGAQGMTEPEAGSDTSAIGTAAARRGDHWVLNGRKAYVTNAPIADVFIVFAKTSPGRGAGSLSAFIIERSFPGVRVGGNTPKLGLRTTPLAKVEFEDCEVPAANLLGGEGNGTTVFRTGVESERCYLSASNLGAMKRQLEHCVEHARRRRQFGRPIGHFQALAHKLAAIKVDIEMAELMLYKIGWLRKSKKPAFFESAAVKLFTSESYVRASLTALQIHGAAGYMEGSGVERQLRDSMASTLYAGTSEIQREILAAWLGLDPQSDEVTLRERCF